MSNKHHAFYELQLYPKDQTDLQESLRMCAPKAGPARRVSSRMSRP